MSDRKAVIGPALGYDPNFGGIDLSGCPSVRELPKDTSFIDENFGGFVAESQGGNPLKRFIEQQAAEQTPSTTVHVGDAEFRVYYKDGLWRGKGIFNGELRRFTGDSRDAVLTKVMALAKRETIRELTAEQKLEVIRICQTGDRLTAIGAYLKHRLGEAVASKYDSPIEMMSDPALVSVMNQCCEFCWFHSNPHAVDTPEWHEYKERILAGRPATFDLLDAIWLRYQDYVYAENESRATQPQRDPRDVRETQPTLAELNDLNDDDVERLMADSKKLYAREVRAGLR